MSNNASSLVLVNKQWLSPGITPAQLSLLMLAITLAIFVCMGVIIYPDASWGERWLNAIELVRHIDWRNINWINLVLNLFVCVLFVLQFHYFYRAHKLERLTLSPDGIRYTSPLPLFIKHWRPDWYVRWADITKLEMRGRQKQLVRADFALLVISTSSQTYQVAPTFWVRTGFRLTKHLRIKFVLTPSERTHEEALAEVMDSEVMQYKARVLPDMPIATSFNKGLDTLSLEKNPYGRTAIAIIFGLMGYAIIDLIIGPDSYASDPSALGHIYIGAGLLCAFLSATWLSRSNLGKQEKLGLPLLIGVVAGFAMIPGALRINAMTGGNDETPTEYFVTKVGDGVLLKPVAQGYPAIDHFARNEYWDRYKEDDIYHVRLHMGVLGFYQFSSKKIVDEIHTYISVTQ